MKRLSFKDIRWRLEHGGYEFDRAEVLSAYVLFQQVKYGTLPLCIVLERVLYRGHLGIDWRWSSSKKQMEEWK